MDESNRQSRKTQILFLVAAAALILFRTLPFVLFGKETLNADEAVYAIMGRDIALGRAFPVFMYGQKYILAQSSWMAAPLFWLWGSSVALFRLPLLLVNFAVGLLLNRMIRTESKLSARDAFICSLWFLLPSMRTSYGLMHGGEGVIEPFLYLLMIWLLRKRPVLGGLLAGIGISVRPFVLYGVVALFFLEFRTANRSLSQFLRKTAKSCFGIAVTCSLVRILSQYSTYYYGRTNPFYWKPVRHMLEDVRGYFAEIMTQTLGLQVSTFPRPGMQYETRFNLLGFALCGVGAYLLFIFLRKLWRERNRLLSAAPIPQDLQFGYYLAMIGLLSFGAYVVMSPPSDDIRYTYQLLFGMVGIYILVRQLGATALVQRLSLVLLFGCVANNLFSDVQNWLDLSKFDREHPSENLIHYLQDHGIRAALGSYWCSHNFTFLSNEAVVVSPGLMPNTNIPRYSDVFLSTPQANRAEISFEPCLGGQKVEYWWVCPDVTNR